MFILVGITHNISLAGIGGDFEDIYEKEPVATFSSDALAQQYIDDHKTDKNIKDKSSYSGDVWFSKTSLLIGCSDAEIMDVSSLPSDPS